jgi:hypothetical protein
MHRTKFFIGALSVILIGLYLPTVSSNFTFKRAHSLQDDPALIYFSTSSEAKKWCLYDSDPNHIWNRLYRSLYMRATRDGREYGYDELDPLFWYSTKYLFSGPAYQQAIKTLDEFLDTHAERLISDPLKRAMLQRDLWAIFDWTTVSDYSPSPARRELEVRLAQVIRRLALPVETIRALPNNYENAAAARTFAIHYDSGRPEQAFLPPDLFQPNGPWVLLSARGGDPAAPGHVFGFSGRSIFLIFMRLPEGRDATLAYLRKMSEFSRPWIPDERNVDHFLPNPELPQFPVGTQLALVREMMLIDDQANLIPTSIVEDLQIRVHRAIPQQIPATWDTDRSEARTSVDTYEFKLSRTKLFARDSGGLRPVSRDEKEFPVFQSHGIDLFELTGEPGHIERELRPVLSSCSSCHFRPGIHSMLSRSVRHNIIPSWDSTYEASTTRGWKQRQYGWGLLQGLWQQQPPTVRAP